MRSNHPVIFAAVIFSALLSSCGEKVEPEIVIEHVVDTLYIVTPTTDISGQMVSIQAFDVLPENSAAVNKVNLQKAIDACASAGAALYVTPAEDGYKVDAGLVLKKNVSLIGAHGPTGRGTCNKAGDGPTGSLFVITDSSAPFITVESATQISGVQFYYPNQPWQTSRGIIEYPPTIQTSHETSVTGVTLRDLSFYGEYFAMDFCAPAPVTCEQILFENCYGYPLSGQFIAIDRCYDIPRILHCHVNPANMREFGRSYNLVEIVDYVADKKNFTYWINNTDNLIIMDVFAYGVHGGIYLGPATYGQLTSFSFDCCREGIHVCGDGGWNRNWDISQGAIVANIGADYTKVHPFVIEGSGHTAISNVEAFSGMTGFTSVPGPNDFIKIEGAVPSNVTLYGCHMQNYVADFPINVLNPKAKVRATDCIDRDGNYFNYETDGYTEDLPHGVTTMFEACESPEGWYSDLSSGISADKEDKTEGNASLSATGKGVVLFQKALEEPLDARVEQMYGHFLIDIYVSDAECIDFTQQGAIEVTSSGTYDNEEASWPTTDIPALKTGWNSLDLKIIDSNYAGVPDFHSMDFFRFYHLGINGDVTIKIDNIRFYEE